MINRSSFDLDVFSNVIDQICACLVLHTKDGISRTLAFKSGMETGRMPPERVNTSTLYRALQAEFGFGLALIELYYHPHIYLSARLIMEKGWDKLEAELANAEEITKIPATTATLVSTAMQREPDSNSRLYQLVRNNFYQGKSGDIYVIQQPYHHLISEESTPLARCTSRRTTTICSYRLFLPATA